MKEHMHLLNGTATLPVPNGLHVRVRILDIKNAYGNVRALVTPVAGERTAWVNLNTLHNFTRPDNTKE